MCAIKPHHAVHAAGADTMSPLFRQRSRRPHDRRLRPPTLFFDDFSSGQLDRSKWNVIVTGRTVNNEQQAYVDSADTIQVGESAESRGAEHGALIIRARRRPAFKTAEGRAFDFISGRLESQSRFEFTYGTAAARIKLTAGAGLWPAFWVLGNGRWPDTGEIDVMENVGDPTWTNFAMHGPGYSGNTPFASRQHFRQGGDSTGWHVYSMDWTADAVVFKVDGTEEYRVTKPMVERYGRWAVRQSQIPDSQPRTRRAVSAERQQGRGSVCGPAAVNGRSHRCRQCRDDRRLGARHAIARASQIHRDLTRLLVYRFGGLTRTEW